MLTLYCGIQNTIRQYQVFCTPAVPSTAKTTPGLLKGHTPFVRHFGSNKVIFLDRFFLESGPLNAFFLQNSTLRKFTNMEYPLDIALTIHTFSTKNVFIKPDVNLFKSFNN